MVDSTSRMLERWEGNAARAEAVDGRAEVILLTIEILLRNMFSGDSIGSEQVGRRSGAGKLLKIPFSRNDRSITVPQEPKSSMIPHHETSRSILNRSAVFANCACGIVLFRIVVPNAV
jgi:hypothetical protein